MVDQLTAAADVGGDDRDAERHRLEDRVGVPLVVSRGRDQDVEQLEEVCDVLL